MNEDAFSIELAKFQIAMVEEKNRYFEQCKWYMEDLSSENKRLKEQLEKVQNIADGLRKDNNELYIQTAQLARKLQNERLRTVELNTIRAAINKEEMK